VCTPQLKVIFTLQKIPEAVNIFFMDAIAAAAEHPAK
jgi:hypothetical protein